MTEPAQNTDQDETVQRPPIAGGLGVLKGVAEALERHINSDSAKSDAEREALQAQKENAKRMIRLLTPENGEHVSEGELKAQQDILNEGEKLGSMIRDAKRFDKDVAGAENIDDFISQLHKLIAEAIGKTTADDGHPIGDKSRLENIAQIFKAQQERISVPNEHDRIEKLMSQDFEHGYEAQINFDKALLALKEKGASKEALKEFATSKTAQHYKEQMEAWGASKAEAEKFITHLVEHASPTVLNQRTEIAEKSQTLVGKEQAYIELRREELQSQGIDIEKADKTIHTELENMYKESTLPVHAKMKAEGKDTVKQSDTAYADYFDKSKTKHTAESMIAGLDAFNAKMDHVLQEKQKGKSHALTERESIEHATVTPQRLQEGATAKESSELRMAVGETHIKPPERRTVYPTEHKPDVQAPTVAANTAPKQEHGVRHA